MSLRVSHKLRLGTSRQWADRSSADVGEDAAERDAEEDEDEGGEVYMYGWSRLGSVVDDIPMDTTARGECSGEDAGM